ncbi:MAG: hypothetical protein ACI4PS_03375 [Rhodocyclaceae bacterium]
MAKYAVTFKYSTNGGKSFQTTTMPYHVTANSEDMAVRMAEAKFITSYPGYPFILDKVWEE